MWTSACEVAPLTLWAGVRRVPELPEANEAETTLAKISAGEGTGE